LTNPTITYGHGYSSDCNDLTGWTATTSGGLINTYQVDSDDIFKLGATFASAADEYLYLEKDVDNLATDTYTTYVIRWKTSASSNGAKAKVVFVFTSGSQTVDLGFNTQWQVATGTLTAGKTLDKVQLWLDDDPNSLASGTFYVYFDFLIICKGVFTFPYIAPGSLRLHVPNRWGMLEIGSRLGDIPQYLGMESPVITLEGSMDDRTGWYVDGVHGGRLYEVMYWQAFHSDPFEWFSSDLIKCKVAPVDFEISQDSEKPTKRNYTLTLRHYSRSSGALSTWADLAWFGF
jgi:hypothetical protein